MTEPDYAAMAGLIDDLEASNDRLGDLAEGGNVPAVELNAARIDAIIAVLRMNLPPELGED